MRIFGSVSEWSYSLGSLGGLNQAHNGYIEIYLNLGWVGLTLLGAMVIAGYRQDY